MLTAVFEEAKNYAVKISGTELIGLIPADAVVGTARNIPIREFIAPNQILENRLQQQSR